MSEDRPRIRLMRSDAVMEFADGRTVPLPDDDARALARLALAASPCANGCADDSRARAIPAPRVDVWEFERAVVEAMAPSVGAEADERLGLLRHADALYGGGFMPCMDDPSLAAGRERLAALHLGLMRELVAGEAEHGGLACAEQAARRGVALHPECMASHEILIAFLESTGRRAEAVSCYERMQSGGSDGASLPMLDAYSAPAARSRLLPPAPRRSKRRRAGPRRALGPAALRAMAASLALAGGVILRGRAPHTPPPPARSLSSTPTGTVLASSFQAALDAGAAAYQRGDYREAEARLIAALQLAGQDAPAGARAGTLLQLGEALEARGDFGRARACYTRALAIRHAEDTRDTEAPTLESLGMLTARMGDLERGHQLVHESLSIRRQYRDALGTTLSLRSLGWIEREQGRCAQARSRYEEALRVVAPLDKPAIAADLRASQGLVARDEGRLVEARARIEGALSFWRGTGHPRWIATTERQLATVAFRQGRYGEAEALLRQSAARLAGLGDRFSQAETDYWLGEVMNARGDRAAARLLFDRAARAQHAAGARLSEARTFAALARRPQSE